MCIAANALRVEVMDTAVANGDRLLSGRRAFEKDTKAVAVPRLIVGGYILQCARRVLKINSLHPATRNVVVAAIDSDVADVDQSGSGSLHQNLKEHADAVGGSDYALCQSTRRRDDSGICSVPKLYSFERQGLRDRDLLGIVSGTYHNG